MASQKISPVTDVEKIQKLPWYVTGDSLNTGFFLLTFSGSIFILFLNELQLNTAQIGLLLSLVPFVGIIAPFIGPWVARFGYKRTFITFWGIRNFVFALMLLTPLILAQFGQEKVFYWVAGIILAFALCRSIAETGGYPWRKAAVPDTIRGKFIAINSMSTTVAGILVTIIASYVIEIGTGLSRFMVLMTVGITLGLVSVWVYTHVPDGTKKQTGPANVSHKQAMKQSLKDKNFVLFLVTLGLVVVGSAAVISFVPLYMTDVIGLSEGSVVLLSVGTYLGALISSYWWGWIADRYGSQPIMQFSIILIFFLPIGWMLMPRNSALSLPVALLIAFVAGVATLAWQISWIRYLFNTAIPSENAAPYTAVYYAWFGFIGGLGPLLIGQILRLTTNFEASLWIFHFDSYTPVFILSLVLLTTSMFTMSRLSSADATPFRRLASMFWRGNPIRALESLVQYNFSATEDTRIAITERMGDAGNPLSTYELIEVLNDPSFNVRYEAIHSIGRMPPEPELVDALLVALDEGKSELSFVITRSLGRLGDPRAIEPLRKLLFSGYHLLEANAARALGMLGDSESLPHFLYKLDHEPNPVLKIAYISALGHLRSDQAIDQIFAVLRQTSNETYRAEIGLALARIAGDEKYYMQHWHSLRTNPATNTAQALLALQKQAVSAKQDTLAAQFEPCAGQFAQNKSAQGTSQLQEINLHLSQSLPDTPQGQILAQCAASLSEFGDSRLEIILLSLHTINIILNQLQQNKPELHSSVQ